MAINNTSNNNVISDIAKNLKDAREEKGISQKHLSELIGVSKSTYSRYESGETPIPTGTLLALCKELNVTPDYIIYKKLSKDKSHGLNLMRIKSLIDNIDENNKQLFIKLLEAIADCIKD